MQRSNYAGSIWKPAGWSPPSGVRGEVKMELWCDGVDFLRPAGKLYLSPAGGRSLAIESIRPQGRMALVKFAGVDDMDAARALRGQAFYFDRDDVQLAPGRWYVADLIGCEVRDADTGKVYGVVTGGGPPGSPGHLYCQGAQWQGVYVPRGGCLFEGAQPARGLYHGDAHPRPAWMTAR